MLAFFSVGPLEIAVLAIIALLVLGPARLPEAARSVGKGMREMRNALQGGDDDEDDRHADEDDEDDEDDRHADEDDEDDKPDDDTGDNHVAGDEHVAEEAELKDEPARS